MNKIQGEYWITGSDVLFADGDVGDTNHEGIVIDHARRELLCLAGADTLDTEFCTEKDFLAAMQELAEDLKEDAPHGFNDAVDLACRIAEDSIPNGLGDCAKELGDTRIFAIKTWNWIWVKKNNIAANSPTQDTLKQIKQGINNILEQEGEYEIPEDAVELYNLSFQATGKIYETTLADLSNLKTGQETFRETLCAPNLSPDRNKVHPIYKGNLGD